MKVTLVKSNLEARITGSPAVVSFSVTQRQLNALNAAKRNLRNAISFNEHYNTANGLPSPEARMWLHSVYADTFGIESGTLTMAHLRIALSR